MKRGVLTTLLLTLFHIIGVSQGVAKPGNVVEYVLPAEDNKTGQFYIGRFDMGTYEISCNVSGIHANSRGWKIAISKNWGVSAGNPQMLVIYNYIGGIFYAQNTNEGHFDLWWDSNFTVESQQWTPFLKVEYQQGLVDYKATEPARTSATELLSPLTYYGSSIGINNKAPRNYLEIDNGFSFHSSDYKVIGLGYSISNKSMLDGYVGEMRWDPKTGGYSINTSATAVKTGDVATFTNRLTINSTGNIGIGTNDPLAKLHVKNGDNSYGVILAQANESNFQLYTKTLTTQPTSVESFRLGLKYGSDENNSFISFYRGGGTSGGFLGLSTNGVERFRITTDGKVGIGTGNPKNALDVVGTIRATEIKVEAAPWPDYVFEDNYQLKSLNDIKAYIKEHKHLPDVPSAEMMAKEGVNLGEVNKLLMQKIEELTLYVIDLEEKNAAQESQLSQIQQLQADLDLLKKMVLTQLNK